MERLQPSVSATANLSIVFKPTFPRLRNRFAIRQRLPKEASESGKQESRNRELLFLSSCFQIHPPKLTSRKASLAKALAESPLRRSPRRAQLCRTSGTPAHGIEGHIRTVSFHLVHDPQQLAEPAPRKGSMAREPAKVFRGQIVNRHSMWRETIGSKLAERHGSALDFSKIHGYARGPALR